MVLQCTHFLYLYLFHLLPIFQMMDSNMQELEAQKSKGKTIAHESRKRSRLYYARHREEISKRHSIQ